MTLVRAAAPTRFDLGRLRQRATALALALAANLLLLLVLLMLNAPYVEPPRFGRGPVLLDLRPDAPAPAEQTASTARTEAPAAEPAEPVPVPERPAVIPPVVEPLVPDDRPLPFLVLSKDDMAASDIGKLKRRDPKAGQGDGQLAAAGGAPGDSERVGTAPNGEPLYHAEWHRRPTDAQLAPYLPDRMPEEGWGLVACRTVERYRVEDCVELGDSPPGSRLAGAVRQAAWQFLVRPPRLGGKPLVGSWVRIRIEYSRSRS